MKSDSARLPNKITVLVIISLLVIINSITTQLPDMPITGMKPLKNILRGNQSKVYVSFPLLLWKELFCCEDSIM